MLDQINDSTYKYELVRAGFVDIFSNLYRKNDFILFIDVIVKKCHFDIVFQRFSQPLNPLC